jgi:hypothetical protein
MHQFSVLSRNTACVAANTAAGCCVERRERALLTPGVPAVTCRLLAFLRDEEERERLEEIERLRPIGIAVGPYMEYRSAQPYLWLQLEQ